MSYAVNPLGARLGIRGTFECRDATGAVVKTLELSGSVPLEALPISEADRQALLQQLTPTTEPPDGTHDRE